MPISKKAFEHISFLLCDPKHEHRRTLRTALVAEGFRSIKDMSELDVLRDTVAKGLPDLIVLDLDMPDGDASQLIGDIRQGNLGVNPFIPIIAVTWDANMDRVNAAVNAGVDDLLAAPISVASLLGRIEVLIRNRKAFVVTSDYIGPDRRKGERERDSTTPLFHVPNTLREKVAGRRIDMTELQGLIDSVMFQINEQRLIRHSFQISFLVNLIVPALKEGRAGRDTDEHIRRLAEIANECGMRLLGSSFEHVGELCRTLIEVTSRVAADPQSPNPRDLDLLVQLSHAVLAGFNPARGKAEMAGEITDMVKKFAERANADALRRAAARSQASLDARRTEEQTSRQKEAELARSRVLKEKLDARRATDQAALVKAKEKADSERLARQQALPVKIAASEQPRDVHEWKEGRAKARKRGIESSSRG